MLYWIRYPCIRIAASFAAGILFYYYTCISFKWLILLFTVTVISFGVAHKYLRKNRFHQFNLVISLSAFGCIFILGGLCIHARDVSVKKNNLARIHTGIDHYMLQVTDVPDTSGQFCKVQGKVRLVRNNGSWSKAHCKILIYLPKSTIIQFGDILLIQGRPHSINPPLNPDEFNYQQFMRHKSILYQHFIRNGEFIKLKYRPGFSIYGISIKARNGITGIITNRFSDKLTIGIMLALLTGQRNYIDPETYDKFIDIGTVHTLAVSGLHVGIIYMFLLILFKPLNRNTWSKKISLCLKILVLLFFAFLTGLSPSVLRASLMFSIMITGKILDRNSHLLNSVFLSAFLLLCIDPYLLFDVSFQLSYSAVTSIILFQPMIYGILHSRFFLVDWAWRLTSVSIAAQLGTLPISLFYFNQLPTYFLLGNMIAIPYVTFTIITGIILIIISPIKIFSWFLVFLLEHLSNLFVNFLCLVQSLPYGIIHPIHIYSSQAVLLSAGILSLYIMIIRRKWKIALITTSCLLGTASTDLYFQVKHQTEKKIIVYNVPGVSCIELVDGHEGILIVPDLSADQKSKIDFHTRNHIIKSERKTKMYHYAQIPEKLPTVRSEGLLICVWNGKSIVILFEKCNLYQLRSIPVDYLIISNNIINLKDLRELNLPLDHVIWDSSNRGYPRTSYGLPINSNKADISYSRHHVRFGGPFIDHLN